MNREETYQWIGLPLDHDPPVSEAVIEGMKDVPVPQTAKEEIAAFQFLLKVCKTVASRETKAE